MDSCTQWLLYISVADPNVQIRREGGGGEGGGHSDPEIRGRAVSKIFLRPFGAQFGLKIRGAGGRAGPCPGSATTSNPLYRTNVRKTLKCFFCDKAILDDSQRDLS